LVFLSKGEVGSKSHLFYGKYNIFRIFTKLMHSNIIRSLKTDCPVHTHKSVYTKNKYK
jgi:hypothetical protein